MLDNPLRQHGRAENSPSPLSSFSGSPNTSSQFYDLPRRTGNSNIRSSGFPSDTVPLKTSNDWHVPFHYVFPTCPRVSFATPLSNSAENTTQPIEIMSTPCPDISQNPQLVSQIMQTPNPVMSYNFITNIPMFFESSPDLWFKVVDAIFDENKVFSESSRFRLTVLKLNSNQLEIAGDLLLGSHPRPYFETKRLLTQTYGITDQQSYVS